ncbi:putative phosphoribosyltransferase [Sinorhizobium kostiense]|uniref:Phosphoribosyltransferase n=1 Tax=Sinorhizobium kostiense TaxID=76747 RepID=A0ABS4QSE2_9HYPH|nr:phosphoribosyltransferase [Sinorhizobium kostiense]MBP2233572.1 putative phosphoribosyltransferase [Sinorhizobium kostiense]
MHYSNRSEAGQQLAMALDHYRGQDVIVLALPRGGVPVAAEVANHLGAPLDLLLVRKIGVPWQPELAMGAVIDGSKPAIVRNEETIRLAGISDAEFDGVCQRELAEIERRRRLYFGDRPPAETEGRVVIIIDDGIATGATVRAAVIGLKAKKPARIVVAVPVAPPGAVAEIKKEADEVVCPLQPRMFGAIGYFYGDFEQLTDGEVIRILSEHKA